MSEIEFTVHSISSDGRTRVDGAVSAAGVTWRDATGEWAARHPGSLAAVLAELIGLGPRDGTFAPDVERPLSWNDVEALAGPGTLHIVLSQQADERAARTALVVLDCDGFALVGPAGTPRCYHIRPAAPTAVWAELCALLSHVRCPDGAAAGHFE